MGERVQSLSLRDRFQLRREGRLVFADALRLDGAAALASPSWLAGHEALCTLVSAGGGADAAACDAARAVLAREPVVGGASLVHGVLVVRALGASGAIRRALTALCSVLRANRLGFGAAMPRVWSC
jgi:urease accessory protein